MDARIAGRRMTELLGLEVAPVAVTVLHANRELEAHHQGRRASL